MRTTEPRLPPDAPFAHGPGEAFMRAEACVGCLPRCGGGRRAWARTLPARQWLPRKKERKTYHIYICINIYIYI
jgi:hypothetical protein